MSNVYKYRIRGTDVDIELNMLKTVTILCLAIGILDSTIIKKPSICVFPFIFKGQSYDECIKVDSKYYWCSPYEIYNGTFSYCQERASDESFSDDNFLELIKKSDENIKRLEIIKSSMGNQVSHDFMFVNSL